MFHTEKPYFGVFFLKKYNILHKMRFFNLKKAKPVVN